MDILLEKSEALQGRTDMDFLRYLHGRIQWNNRLIGIKGARGTGKTTLMLQRMKELQLPPTQAAYLSLDDLYFTVNTLADTAAAFYRGGGKVLFLDEVHKYPGWARHIKNIYDFYPDLQIVFTGSSIIDIAREEADLSRRVRMYELQGLSYREYLRYAGIASFEPLTLQQLTDGTGAWRKQFPKSFRPLEHFSDYLRTGYYPFFKEDEEGVLSRIQQVVRLIVEYDLAALKDFDIRNARKLLQLLYLLSEQVPFKPNLSALADKSGVHRNSMGNYLYFLEQAKLIRMLYPAGVSVSTLQKPEKLYLENTNLAHALAVKDPEQGNIRETFLLNQLLEQHQVHYPKEGDFLVDGVWTFEVGGRTKKHRQLKERNKSFVVADDVAYPVAAATLPLWLMGFLY